MNKKYSNFERTHPLTHKQLLAVESIIGEFGLLRRDGIYLDQMRPEVLELRRQAIKTFNTLLERKREIEREIESKNQEIKSMTDYSKMTTQDFDSILEEILAKHTGNQIAAINGDIQVLLAEAFNDDVLDIWASRNPELAHPEDYKE